MLNRIKVVFHKWNDLLRACSECGGETENTNRDYIDYTLCEFSVRCKECKTHIACWAYGSWDGPITRTEAAHVWFLEKKYKVMNFFGK